MTFSSDRCVNSVPDSEIIDCPCQHYESIESIVSVLLDNSTHSDRLIGIVDWLSGELHHETPSSRKDSSRRQHQLSCGFEVCKKRCRVSFLILNSIRDTCRPFLSASNASPSKSPSVQQRDARLATSKTNEIQSNNGKYDNEYPTLQSTLSVTKKSGQSTKSLASTSISLNLSGTAPKHNQRDTLTTSKKNKKRIRPTVAISVTSSSTGNLVNLSSTNDEFFPPPPRLGIVQSPVVVVLPRIHMKEDNGNKHDNTYENVQQSNIVFCPATPNQTPRVSNVVESCNLSNYVVLTPDAPKATVCTPKKSDSRLATKSDESESGLDLPKTHSLENLVEVYCALITSCLVPSSFVEVQFLLRLLSLGPSSSHDTITSTGTVNKENLSVSSILSSHSRCVLFAARSLQKLSDLLLFGFGVNFLQDLIRNDSFQKNLPEVTDSIVSIIQSRITTTETFSGFGSVAFDQKAFFALPFKESRDSRHNYRTKAEQMMYNNRENSRDAFLHHLRSYLSIKGKIINYEYWLQELRKLKQASCEIVQGLLSSNLKWFSEFFCDMLLQIGLIPLQETDIDLLHIADQEKLQKLHHRFSSQSAQDDKSTKLVITAPNNDTTDVSPIVAAQRYFPGHQEFFYLFLVYSDAYSFSIHLRSKLIETINEIMANITQQNAERQIMEMCLMARFLGVLCFSPNWLPRNTVSDESRKSSRPLSLDGLWQLSESGLPVLKLLNESIQTGKLILVVPWIVELLKLAQWDQSVLDSSVFVDVIASLRQIQVKIQKNQSSVSLHATNRILLVQAIESYCKDAVGLMTIASLPYSPSVADPTCAASDVTLDTVAITSSVGILFAVNRHVEDLMALVSKLTKIDPIQVHRTPGATRKLRPSVVSPPTLTFATLSESETKNFSEINKVVQGGAKSGSMESKLRERFFQQHDELKTLCEFAVSRVLKVAKTSILDECAESLVHECIDDDADVVLARQKIRESCNDHVKSLLQNQLNKVLSCLVSSDVDKKIADVAVALSVTHGLSSCAQIIDNIVEHEINKIVSSAADAKRQLFSDKTVSTNVNKQKYPKILNPCDVQMQNTTLIMIKVSDFTRTLVEDVTGFLSILTELDLSLSTMIQKFTYEIPSEKILRPFFVAVLKMDECSFKIIDLGMEEVPSTLRNDKWNVLKTFLIAATRIASFSHNGLRNVTTFFCCAENIIRLLERGSKDLDAVEDFGNLLLAMMRSKIIRSLDLKYALAEPRFFDDEQLARLRRVVF